MTTRQGDGEGKKEKLSREGRSKGKRGSKEAFVPSNAEVKLANAKMVYEALPEDRGGVETEGKVSVKRKRKRKRKQKWVSADKDIMGGLNPGQEIPRLSLQNDMPSEREGQVEISREPQPEGGVGMGNTAFHGEVKLKNGDYQGHVVVKSSAQVKESSNCRAKAVKTGKKPRHHSTITDGQGMNVVVRQGGGWSSSPKDKIQRHPQARVTSNRQESTGSSAVMSKVLNDAQEKQERALKRKRPRTDGTSAGTGTERKKGWGHAKDVNQDRGMDGGRGRFGDADRSEGRGSSLNTNRGGQGQ
ncbi:unnamed protein product, partial [Choristocarpus tenellus]